MGRKQKHSKRHARGRKIVRSRRDKATKKRWSREASAFTSVHKLATADGPEPIDNDNIPATAGNDNQSNEPGNVPAGGNESV